MASTLTATKAGSTIQARAGIGLTAAWGEYELTAALVANDVIQMCHVPKGATILEIIVGTDDLDSASSPAIVLDVGDGTTHDRFIKQSTIAQAGGITRLAVMDGLQYAYTAADTIDIKVHTAPTTGATSGTLRLTALYSMDD